MRLIFPAAACALAACSAQPPANNVADNATPAEQVAAAEAPTRLDISESPAAMASPAPLDPPAPGEPGGLDDDRTPVSEAPFTAESAQGAANVVQTYYALIGEKKYRQAWALWSDGGRASGMSADAFAASFDKYSEYRANIGAPGRIDAGAGQRYVTVPVQVYGRLKQGGRPFNLRGSITLHRTADIDGATPEQRSWHIRSADLPARPGEATPAPAPSPSEAVDNRSVARYRCVDGSRFTARFDPDNRRVTIVRDGARQVLRDERVASGIRYAGGGWTLQGKGDTLTLRMPNTPPLPCTVNRR